MNVFGEFHFLRPLWLALIPVAAVCWWLIRRWKDPLLGWRAVMEPQLLSALTVGETPRSAGREFMLLVAWLLAAFSLAGPTWRPEPSPFADDPVPVMILLKAGETMQASDLSPSRMERAQLKVADLAEARKGQPTGLIAWAGTAHLVLPPTRDASVVASMAMEISPDIMPRPGDELPTALELATKTLADTQGSLVLVADTLSTASAAALRSFAESSRLPIYILAIAREETPELEDLRKVASDLNASVTVMSPDSRDVDSLVRSTAQVPIAVADAAEGVRWSESGWWLVPVLSLLALAGFRRVEDRGSQEAAA